MLAVLTRDRHRIAVPRRSACRTGPVRFQVTAPDRLARRRSRPLAGRTTHGLLDLAARRLPESARACGCAHSTPRSSGSFPAPRARPTRSGLRTVRRIAFFAERQAETGGCGRRDADRHLRCRESAWRHVEPGWRHHLRPHPNQPTLPGERIRRRACRVDPARSPARDESPLAPFPPRWRSLSLLGVCGAGRERQRAARRLPVQARRAGSRSRYDGQANTPTGSCSSCGTMCCSRSPSIPTGVSFRASLERSCRTPSGWRPATTASRSRAPEPWLSTRERLPRDAATRLTWLARSGRTLGTIGDTGDYFFPAIAPDQNRVTVTRTENRATDIFMFEGPAWTAARLTTNPLPDFASIWSPDGRRIAYASAEVFGAGTNLVLVPAEGAAARTVAHADQFQLTPGGWAADGRDCVSGVRQPGALEPLDEGRRRPRGRCRFQE